MPTAVVRVMVDFEGRLSPLRFAAGVASLEGQGLDVVASPPQHLPDRRREIELIIDGDAREVPLEDYRAMCSRAFGTDARLGVVTYISRGTDDDARGVLRRFGVSGAVEREVLDGGDDVVTVTIARDDLGRVPESRLHTALEAALNCDVRIVLLSQA